MMGDTILLPLDRSLDGIELGTDAWPGIVCRPIQAVRGWDRDILNRELRNTTVRVLQPDIQCVELGYEVLVHIMFLAAQDEQRWTLCALMRTCKTLYHHGSRFLMSFTVELHRRRLISSFTSFMLSPNNPPLFTYLRGRMRIWFYGEAGDKPISAMPEHIARPFVEVLARCIHLRSLHIHNLHTLLDSHPDLCSALSALPALQDLLINITHSLKRHRLIARFFRALRCPLVLIRLEFGSCKHGKQVEYRREADPMWLFAGVASTLQGISLAGTFQLGTTHVYPRVWKCHIDAMSCPSLRPFITSFPALRAFASVPRRGLGGHTNQDAFKIDHSPNPGPWSSVDENVSTWESYREANRKDQLANGSWDSLDTLIANSLIAYTFGLTCSVRRVHLLLHLDRDDRTVLMVANVLRDTQPRSLRLAFYMLDIAVVTYMLEYLVYVRYHLLELELRLNITDDNFDLRTFLDQVATALEHSNITSLRVELMCFKRLFPDIIIRECGVRRSQDILDYCVTKAALDCADIPEIIGHFMALNDRLRRVEIAWSSCHFDYGLERGIGVDLDVGPEVYDVPCEDYPDDWDAAW
ncbi:hypothetical protein K466DRAFT_30443 [Polyporus arcularius HHB13444]|uniref:F-box domain-containing protein n=1 Tax=Polyporus arcularius HHB13444 TaxID=1314778 RepID=A0A5C3PM43_9APHY|nr:hypothetical protein K466DRAFT_30443 [Polyporus arcularius HHB13444]